MINFYPQTLDKQRQKLLPELSFLTQDGFYLAGGTGLVLQLNHRTSQDFDFYGQIDFKPIELLEKLNRVFGSRVKSKYDSDDTLGVEIDGIDSSFIAYRYPIIGKLNEWQGINIASIEDIAAMKCVAIVQRGKKRDFVDIYYLLKMFSIHQILELTIEKYQSYDPSHILTALMYFDDADAEPETSRFQILDKRITWKVVKKGIIQSIRGYQKLMTEVKFN